MIVRLGLYSNIWMPEDYSTIPAVSGLASDLSISLWEEKVV